MYFTFITLLLQICDDLKQYKRSINDVEANKYEQDSYFNSRLI